MSNISLIDGHIDNAEHCVSCGAVIPEGRQVCIICGLKTNYKQPTADVVEVKCSNWELKSRVYKMLDDVDEEFYVECPFCHRTEYVPFELEEEKMLEYARKHYPYCHCGAKMDGKD